jgi:hypothetical protein
MLFVTYFAERAKRIEFVALDEPTEKAEEDKDQVSSTASRTKCIEQVSRQDSSRNF